MPINSAIVSLPAELFSGLRSSFSGCILCIPGLHRISQIYFLDLDDIFHAAVVFSSRCQNLTNSNPSLPSFSAEVVFWPRRHLTIQLMIQMAFTKQNMYALVTWKKLYTDIWD